MNRLLLSPRIAFLARGALLVALAVGAAAARAEEIRIGGTGAGLGTMRALAEAYARQHPGTTFAVLPSLGSGGGIKAVIAGAIHVAVSARPASEAETREGAGAFELGRTPFVFVASPANPAIGLTRRELAEIYAGTLERWPDGSRIRLVMRPVGDSDNEIIKDISPAMRDAFVAAERRPGMLIAFTDQEAADSAERIPGALGPSTLSLVRSERRALKVLAVDGVAPTPAALADGTYPWSKQVFIVTGGRSARNADAFLEFVRSAEGRGVLERAGFWVK